MSVLIDCQPIVALLKRTRLVKAKWKFPYQKTMSVLWYWETSVIQVGL
jgi:hypothetical protein